MTTVAGTRGHAPGVLITPREPAPLSERDKYRKMWEFEQYRAVSPGEQWASTFLGVAKPAPGSSAIDFGCGTGRGAFMLGLLGGMKVQMVDFADNCLDPEVRQALTTQAHALSFTVADLTTTNGLTAQYGYCCDVMEHIPEKDVPIVLTNILGSCPKVFFGISTTEDACGALIGEHLHLTVKPTEWWLDQLREAGATIHWYESIKNDAGKEVACAVYCGSWKDAKDLVSDSKVNIGDDGVRKNVYENIRNGWTMLTPFNKQDREIVLLAGGPSLAESLDTIKMLREQGAGLVTVNGAYNWALKNDLRPSVQIVLDGREFNKRFLEPVTDYTKYLIASQVSPATLEGLPKDRTLLWHTVLDEEVEKAVLETGNQFYPVPGGSTVVLRAIPLLRMIGFSKIHIFGFDSCLRGDRHHAYEQPENNGGVAIPVICEGRTFWCSPWMAHQASEFRDLVEFLGDEVELAVYGDGLIAHMLATGAKLSTDSEI